MKNKKAAISVEMIVYVAIAVFILVIIIGFATGAFQKLFWGLEPKGEVGTAQDKCEVFCSEAKDEVLRGDLSKWESTDYCTETFAIDKDESGEIDSDEVLHCWNDPIAESCTISKQAADGLLYVCTTEADAQMCSPCAPATSA